MIKYLVFLVAFSKAFSLDFGDPAMPCPYLYEDQMQSDEIEDIWQRRIRNFAENLRNYDFIPTMTPKPEGNIYGK